MSGWRQVYRSGLMTEDEAVAIVKGRVEHPFPFTPDFRSMESQVVEQDGEKIKLWSVVAYAGPLDGPMPPIEAIR